MKSGKTEKLPAVAGKAKNAKKSVPAAVIVAEPAKVDAVEVKAVSPAVATKPAPKKRGVVAKAASATGKGRVSKKLLRGKGLKKKKIQLRFSIDCTNIAEDSIMDVADFVSRVLSLGANTNPNCNHFLFRFFPGKILGRTHQGQR